MVVFGDCIWVLRINPRIKRSVTMGVKKYLPPWCWGRNYAKYGFLLFVMGTANSFISMYLAIWLGANAVPYIALGLTLYGFVYKASIMKHVRPCNDCPINKTVTA